MSAPAPAGGEAIASSDVVLDVSLSTAWCFADEASEPAWAILEWLQGGRAHVPALWLWETANLLVQAERRGRISPAAIRTFLGLLEGLPTSAAPPAPGTTRSPWPAAIASPAMTPPTWSWLCAGACPWPPATRPSRRLLGWRACASCPAEARASMTRFARCVDLPFDRREIEPSSGDTMLLS
jgi:predicted nucleic acid-binding protein